MRSGIFADLPQESRVWVFGLQAPLNEEQEASLRQVLDEYVQRWKSHGDAVSGSYAILERQFIVVAADNQGPSVSGCSIDGMVRTVRSALQRGKVSVADLADIFFRDGTQVRALSREDFGGLVSSGGISADTPVFDLSVQTLADFRLRWEKPFSDSWHADLFKLP